MINSVCVCGQNLSLSALLYETLKSPMGHSNEVLKVSQSINKENISMCIVSQVYHG